MNRLAMLTAAVLLLGLSTGCGRRSAETPGNQKAGADRMAARPAKATEPVPVEKASPALPTEAAAEQPTRITGEEQLQAALKAKNPEFDGRVGVNQDGGNITVVELHDPAVEDISPLAGLPLEGLDLRGCHVTDIRPLAGMPLVMLYLEETGVKDIGVLKGMPLRELYLSNTQVEDISPLEGAPLNKLNLLGTRVTDLGPLRHSPIEMLWLNDTPVSDIAPLATVPLVSLTLAGTKVSDLSPLKGHPLQRLHIAGTPVTDLSVLQWMRLTRLVFTPGRIKTGMQYARNMPTLREIGTSFDGQRLPPPSVFWELYDAGKIK